MGRAREKWVFHLSGGRLCLDFVNTVSWRLSDEPRERLSTYRNLLSWAEQARLLTSREAARLAREGRRRPADADRVLRKAIGVRELIHRIFSTIVDGEMPGSTDLARLNRFLSDGLSRLQVTVKGDRFSLEWARESQALDWILWPVVRSAAELLASDHLHHVRKCAASNCGWIFLDTSRNRKRRWCDMRVCGNRSKVHRHYERQVAGAQRGPRH